MGRVNGIVSYFLQGRVTKIGKTLIEMSIKIGEDNIKLGKRK